MMVNPNIFKIYKHCSNEKCRTKQDKSERYCLKCGECLGDGLPTIIMSLIAALGLPLMVGLGGTMNDALDLINNKTVIQAYYIPLFCGTAFLIDHNPYRSFFYFWFAVANVGYLLYRISS